MSQAVLLEPRNHNNTKSTTKTDSSKLENIFNCVNKLNYQERIQAVQRIFSNSIIDGFSFAAKLGLSKKDIVNILTSPEVVIKQKDNLKVFIRELEKVEGFDANPFFDPLNSGTKGLVPDPLAEYLYETLFSLTTQAINNPNSFFEKYRDKIESRQGGEVLRMIDIYYSKFLDQYSIKQEEQTLSKPEYETAIDAALLSNLLKKRNLFSGTVVYLDIIKKLNLDPYSKEGTDLLQSLQYGKTTINSELIPEEAVNQWYNQLGLDKSGLIPYKNLEVIRHIKITHSKALLKKEIKAQISLISGDRLELVQNNNGEFEINERTNGVDNNSLELFRYETETSPDLLVLRKYLDSKLGPVKIIGSTSAINVDNKKLIAYFLISDKSNNCYLVSNTVGYEPKITKLTSHKTYSMLNSFNQGDRHAITMYREEKKDYFAFYQGKSYIIPSYSGGIAKVILLKHNLVYIEKSDNQEVLVIPYGLPVSNGSNLKFRLIKNVGEFQGKIYYTGLTDKGTCLVYDNQIITVPNRGKIFSFISNVVSFGNKIQFVAITHNNEIIDQDGKLIILDASIQNPRDLTMTGKGSFFRCNDTPFCMVASTQTGIQSFTTLDGKTIRELPNSKLFSSKQGLIVLVSTANGPRLFLNGQEVILENEVKKSEILWAGTILGQLCYVFLKDNQFNFFNGKEIVRLKDTIPISSVKFLKDIVLNDKNELSILFTNGEIYCLNKVIPKNTEKERTDDLKKLLVLLNSVASPSETLLDEVQDKVTSTDRSNRYIAAYNELLRAKALELLKLIPGKKEIIGSEYAQKKLESLFPDIFKQERQPFFKLLLPSFQKVLGWVDQTKIVGGDPKEKATQTMLTLSHHYQGFLATNHFLIYDQDADIWNNVALPLKFKQSGEVEALTATILPSKNQDTIVLPLAQNAFIVPERVVAEAENHQTTIPNLENMGLASKVVINQNFSKVKYTQLIPRFTTPPVEISKKELEHLRHNVISMIGQNVNKTLYSSPPEVKDFLKSIKDKTPLEKLMAIQAFVKDHSYYDLDYKEIQNEFEKAGTKNLLLLMQSRLQDLRAKDPSISLDILYTGVCADFAKITCSILREAGFVSGFASGYLVNGKVVSDINAHGVAFILWPSSEGIQIVYVDSTPSTGDTPFLPYIIPSINEQLITSEAEKIINSKQSKIETSIVEYAAKIPTMTNGELENCLNEMSNKFISRLDYAKLKGFFDFCRFSGALKIIKEKNPDFLIGLSLNQRVITATSIPLELCNLQALLDDLQKLKTDLSGEDPLSLKILLNFIESAKEHFSVNQYNFLMAAIRYLNPQNI